MNASLPDYVTDANAVMKDDNAVWRHGRAPDYTKTRTYWAETKMMNHESGSLPDLVEKLVKNWEVEASFKTNLDDWRTVDPQVYEFSVNGGPAMTGDHMLKVGTYNALIDSSKWYCPVHSDFDKSHKSFKRMMPTFAWEVLEVYSGPPTVAFKWRHWGVFKDDYAGVNDKGETVKMKAHGGIIDIEGVGIAKVDGGLRIQKLEIFFDPQGMFKQMGHIIEEAETEGTAVGDPVVEGPVVGPPAAEAAVHGTPPRGALATAAPATGISATDVTVTSAATTANTSEGIEGIEDLRAAAAELMVGYDELKASVRGSGDDGPHDETAGETQRPHALK